MPELQWLFPDDEGGFLSGVEMGALSQLRPSLRDELAALPPRRLRSEDQRAPHEVSALLPPAPVLSYRGGKKPLRTGRSGDRAWCS